MNVQPRVSVVLSVYDDPLGVEQTIRSVLSQTGVELELVIVSDGADSDVLKIVSSFEDSRIRLIEQSNQGLTVALIKGCERANNDYIARIDSGDTMLPGRLLAQAKVLAEQESVGLVTSFVEIVTEDNCFLYNIEFSSSELTSSIQSWDPKEIFTPFHSSVMFRKQIYEQVGGYRAEFYFAQDCDLWARILSNSRVFVIDEVLTRGVFSSKGLSGRFNGIQRELKSIVAMANARRAQEPGFDESSILVLAKKCSEGRFDLSKSKAESIETLYFIASVLTKNKSACATKYWKKYLQQRPLNPMAWLKFIFGWFLTGRH